MAKYCEVCGKGVTSGNSVSHSHRKSKRKWAPNVQRIRVIENGTPKENTSAHVVCVPAL